MENDIQEPHSILFQLHPAALTWSNNNDDDFTYTGDVSVSPPPPSHRFVSWSMFASYEEEQKFMTDDLKQKNSIFKYLYTY